MKKVELYQFLENIVEEDTKKPNLEQYANGIYCAYSKEEILKLIEIYERIPRCDTMRDSLSLARTYRVLFLLEKEYGKVSVEALISYLKEKVPAPKKQSTRDFRDIKIEIQ